MKDIRRLILRCVLGALALAAGTGVLTALTRSDLLGRLMVSGFVTAVAALLLLPLSHLVDRREGRAAGLVGVVAVTLEFILALMITWEVLSALPVQWDEEELFITGGLVLLGALAAITFLMLRNKPSTRVAGTVGLAVTAAHFALAMAGTWVPRGPASWDWREDFFVTAWSVGAFGVLAAMALVGVGADKRHWRWLGVVASVPAAAMLIVDAWWPQHRGSEIFSLFCTTSLFVAWANLIVRVPLASGQRWLLLSTLLAGALTAGLSEAIVFHVEFEMMDRLTAAASILTGCATLALAVLAALRRRHDPASLPQEFQAITVICPACRRKQALGLGGAGCAGCGLRIDVKLDVPRCAKCDYVLYRLTSPACPECGTPVAFGAAAAPASDGG